MNERFARAGAMARVDLAHEPDFVLGALRVRPSLREIAGESWRETLEPRVMRVLVALARTRGDILSRDDLIESCWDGVIVGDDAINRCIGRLRKVAEGSGDAFAIETIPRVGYRLKIADLATRLPDANVSVAPEAEPNFTGRARLPPTAQVTPPVWARRSVVAIAAGGLALLVTGYGIWWFWPRSARTPSEPATSVAVLPFVNMSGDPKKDYFSDGFSEELVNDLSNVPNLRVASRTSSFAFKGKNGDIQSIARALRVHAIVEGSVRESGDRVRITAQLIDAGNGYHLWSADYTRNLTDILFVQDELARAIAAQLTHRLMPTVATASAKIDPAVYRLFLEGVHQFDLGPTEGWRSALAIFKQVTAKAPNFVGGFIWLARTALDLATNYYDAVPASDYAIASDAAQRVLSLDSHNVHGLSDRALIELYTWNWRAAAADMRLVRSEKPNSYSTISGLWNYYGILGFSNEAFAQWQRLRALEPQTYSNSVFTVWALDGAGRFQEEIPVAQAQLANSPRDTGRMAYLCNAFAGTGKIVQARAVAETLRSLQMIDSQNAFQSCEWSSDIATGNHADALRLLHRWEKEFPDKIPRAYEIARDYILLGDFEKASDWFLHAYERRESQFFASFCMKGFGYEKAIERYRLTPAYKALAEKPLFKAWQAEHDRIAAALAAHRDPLSLP